MNRCPSCDATLSPSDASCPSCVVPVVAQCAECAALIAAGAKFCSERGAPVRSEPSRSPAPAIIVHQPEADTDSRALWPEGEKRRLTLLFCDLVGSTSIGQRLDPEEYSDLIGRARRELLALGDTPNTAARVESVTPRGKVGISEATRKLVGGLFDINPARHPSGQRHR